MFTELLDALTSERLSSKKIEEEKNRANFEQEEIASTERSKMEPIRSGPQNALTQTSITG